MVCPENSAIERAGLVAAVDQAADGIVITDTTGAVQYVNPAFTALTGYTKEEVVGQNPRILKSGQMPAAFYEELWRTIRSGQVWHGEVINRRKDGKLYCEEMQITPVHGSQGEIVSYIAIKRDVTRRWAENEAQAFLAAIVENSDDALIALTPAGTILTWNRGAEAMFGYASADTVGKPMSMLAPSERQPALVKLAEQLLRGHMVSHYDGLCLHRDGRRIHVWVTGSLIRNAAGEATAISISLRDISDRKQAEKDRALLASIVESSEDAIFAVKLDGTVVSWNRGAEDLCGYRSREIVGESVTVLGAAGRLERLNRYIEAIRQGSTISSFETILRVKDGPEIDVSISISPIRDSDGEVVGAAVFAHDIGKRLEAERKLRESEERFRQVFEHAPAGVMVVGVDGRLLQVNTALCRMLGYSAEELLETTWVKLTHPDDLEFSRRWAEEAMRTPGAAPDAEKRYIHRNGNVVWTRVRLSTVRDSGGAAVYFVAHVEDVTERKQAEEALRESEERFRIMADGCPAPMWVTDAAGGNAFVNRAYREFCGIASEEVEGARWPLLVHPDDGLDYFESFQRAVRERQPFHAEVRIRRADGAWRWVVSDAAPRFSAGGEYLGHVGLSPDITRRKRAEEALYAVEARHRILAQALESADECISITDSENRILHVNAAFLRVYGYGEHELIGQPIQIVRSARTPEEVQGKILPATLAGSWSGDLWHRSKEGREFPVSLATSVVYDEEGRGIALVGIARDITERNRAEQALQSSEEKFRQLAENIREVFWMMPPAADQILYVSPAYEQVWDRTCESVYQDPASWMDSIHPDDFARAHASFARQVQGEALDSEYRIRTPGGQEKWIRDRAFPIRNQAGQLTRIVGIAEEITERKSYEEELIQAREDAEAANMAKSRFLANMSHEIRTPMNGVIGMVQLLLQTDLTAQQRRFADVVRSSGQALLSLIDNILDLCKIEASKIALEKCAFNPRQTIEDVVQLLETQAKTKRLDFVARVSPDIPALLSGDPHRLRQVLTNLAANAIKFTERGKIVLEAAPESQVDGRITLVFRIADTGIGIRPDEIARIFQPFAQADASTTRKYGGTGLGLSICKQLVEMMGGEIGVRSQEDVGSTFWFTAVFEAAAPGPVESAVDRRVDSPGGTGAREGRVLVAEDNPVNREVVLAQLHMLGYAASAVENGADAVKAVESGDYDLVLMDCQMPVMDGFEATLHIRGSDRPEIPIVAITADAMPADRDRCLKGGMNDYLAKPVELQRLAGMLAKWLPASPGPVVAPAPAEHAEEPRMACAFNKEALLGRLMGDRRLAGAIVSSFLADCPSQLSVLDRKVAAADSPGVRSQAHALKGGAATVAAEELSALAAALEQAGTAGEWERCAELLPRAVVEFYRFRSALESAGWV